MMAPTFDAIAYLRTFGIMSSDEAEQLDAMAKSRYFLVRIDGLGERWRCRRCNTRHTHFTVMCIERPWRGLEQGLYAYWRNIGAGDPSQLSPRQVARSRQIAKMLGLPGQQPNLSTLHPRTAQSLAGDDADTDFGAAGLLGTLDPISETKARLLADLINSRARQIVVRL